MPPIGGPRRRVLLEAADRRLRESARETLEDAGFAVTTCPGPAAGHPCPLLEGRACGLVASSDVVVSALRGRTGRAVLERLPAGEEAAPEVLVLSGEQASAGAAGRESVSAAAGGSALVEAVNRLHGRRARFLRLPVTLRDGRRVTVRAISAADAPLLREFDSGLSARSRQLRYMGSKPPMTEEWAGFLAAVDFERRFALVAIAQASGGERIVADCRLLYDDRGRGELAVVVADDHQGAGLGRLLVELTLRISAARGRPDVYAEVRYDNSAMALLLRSEGFERVGWDLGVMTFERPRA